jgi:hypothetical protein
MAAELSGGYNPKEVGIDKFKWVPSDYDANVNEKVR